MPLISTFSTVARMALDVMNAFKGTSKDAFRKKVDGTYVGVSYTELHRQVEAFALSMRALGLSRGDRIGIMSENRLEWIVTDLACAVTGIVNVPVFPILTPKQIEYIYNDARVKGVVCSNAMQLSKLMKFIDGVETLEHVIVMNEDAIERTPSAREKGAVTFKRMIEGGEMLANTISGQLENLVAQVEPDDLMTLIYTSGTTGNPKGVMLTHRNFAANIIGCSKVLEITPDDVVLSYLPLCHSYERTAGYYTCFACGATIAFADSIETVSENLLEVRPTIMTSVPRLFERIKNRVEKGVASQPEKNQRIFKWGMRVGVEYWRNRQKRGKVGPILSAKNRLADKLVFSKVRARTGGRVRIFVSGGAALPQDVAEFFFALGLTIIEGYGLTETSPVISVNRIDHPRIGTVGKPLFNVEVKIAEDGEILTRGEHVMKGYLNAPEATAEIIDAEGWLHTGDIGVFDSDGYLKITDRKKHLFVSSGGKNIAPGPIEGLLLESRLIDQIMLIGDDRPYITALIVPDYEALKELASAQGVTVGNINDEEVRKRMVELESIEIAVEAEIKRLQRDLSAFERVRRFELLSEPFTVENGLMTPTLKVKRKEVIAKYPELIEGMYAGAEE